MPYKFTSTTYIRQASTLTYSAVFEAYYSSEKEPTRIYASPKMLLRLIGKFVGMMDGKSYRGPLQFEAATFWLDSEMKDNELRFSWVEKQPDGTLRDAPHRDVWLVIADLG